MQIGDKVEIVTIPADLPENDLKTRSLFKACVGRTFPIVGVQGHLLELEVGQVLGQEACMHSIWIEPEHVRLASN